MPGRTPVRPGIGCGKGVQMTTTQASGPPAAAPLEEILALVRDGRLVDRYPRVARLLAGLPDSDVARAGQVLGRVEAGAIAAEHPGTPVVRIAVTGHGTLASLVPALTGQLARHGLAAEVRVFDFDGYVYDLGDKDSRLYASEPELTLCVLDPQTVFDEVPVPWTPADVEHAFAAKLRQIEGLAAVFESVGRGTLVLNTLPLPHRYTAQLVDRASRAELGALWREANAALLRLGADHPRVVVVDLDPLVAEGHPVSEPRLSVYTKAHLSPALLGRYAREIGHLARSATGRGKKVLVVDLDGTMWGGVLGDDGVEGIEVADTYRGEAFRAVQRVVKQLGSQGVLLAVASKNEDEVVRAALRDHPDMTLREDDFVRVAANWRPKDENLRELAEALNLGLDGFVFVDDNPAEVGLVRERLPGVAVVQVDPDPAAHVDRLLADGWFETRELTAEDRARVAKYRDELQRRDFLDSFDSVQDYLRELGVRVRLGVAAPAELARVSQLTLRTNQFNLTTRRLQQAEVAALAADPDWLVLAIRSADRFGDNGLVGAIFVQREGSELRIDNMVLSCRVFSRGIEQACLAALLEHARATGAVAVSGAYQATAKNGVVRDLLPRHGFAEAGTAPDGVTALFRHDLGTPLERPDHLTLEEDLPGGAR